LKAYEPVELKFPESESFKHFNLIEQKDNQDIQYKLVLDNSLSQELKLMAIKFFKEINGVGYGLIKIRYDNKTQNL